ncbi:hypothetical protein SESBI_12634 [Sesbania bispinosa]|nr:hypothetical protein SESBI_12634 [Sesbania bispinosa]
MSLQAQPQQPVQVYPAATTNQPSPHHSNGRYNNNHNNHNPRPVKQHRQQIHNFNPREGDIEFGIDKRNPPTIARPKGLVLGTATGPHPHDNGNMKDFEMKPHQEGELRSGA